MKTLLTLLLLMVAVSMPAARADEGFTECQMWAKAYWSVATDLNNGYSPQAEMAQIKTALDSDRAPQSMRTLWMAAVRDVYSHPTVQPQVWFGFVLARCEATPPVSDFIIIKAPTE